MYPPTYNYHTSCWPSCVWPYCCCDSYPATNRRPSGCHCFAPQHPRCAKQYYTINTKCSNNIWCSRCKTCCNKGHGANCVESIQDNCIHIPQEEEREEEREGEGESKFESKPSPSVQSMTD